MENVKDGLEELPMLNSKASNELLSRITVDPDVSHGKPSIRGLRYPVELMTGRLEQLAELFETHSYVELTRDALIIHV